ncbi:carboxypeptidase regulatory-like domain-containing protein [Altererythrobacter arenosus]|uniref:Carboxypeptidase regulatory-like domain-containing protein n=1 Tax=Altererythrobacter arenosus TaxID=3032592 RepID=A0ABY8FUI7_9SPHN|nr:carboxypeptidase regulatory-like domain-containing protein [Altererythrobacter sp. CAU 1644]WFL78668.1 carboxypeptidase regulatory-like domain-containing protein [Altererythrobacter sp. CAU 1644]
MSNRRTRHWLGAAASFAAALGLCAPGFAQANQSPDNWQVSQDDFLLLQLMVKNYRLTHDVRGYQTPDGVCLDLADVIQSMDLPVRLDKKSRRATGWLFAEDQKFTLDRSSNTVQNVNTASAPLTNEIYDTPEGWCVESGALSRWFGVTFKPDLYNSVVKIESDRPLPFIEAIERKSRAARLTKKKAQVFDLGKYPHAEAEYRLWRAPSIDVNTRVSYRDGGTSGERRETRYELYASGEIAAVSVNARLASEEDGRPDSLRVKAFRYDHDGGLLGPLKATKVEAGDASLRSGQLSGAGAVGRGAFISNESFTRNSRFSATEFRGVLPTGWDAELYRNGQLIAFQTDEDGDGRYEFLDVELYFGRNDFEVILYGPQGQIRTENYSQPVGRALMRPGEFEYWGGILQQNHDLIEIGRSRAAHAGGDWRWGTGAAYGLDDRTSISAGYQSFMLGPQRRHFAEAALQRTLGSMQLELAGSHEFGAGFVTQGNLAARIGGINLSADALWVSGQFNSELVSANLDYRTGMRFDTALKLGSLRMPVQGGVGRARYKDGTKVTDWLIGTALGVRGINLSANLSHQVVEDELVGASSAQTRLALLTNTRIFGLRVRGLANFRLSGIDKGLQTVQLQSDKQIGERTALSFETEYRAQSDVAIFGFGVSRRFDKFAVRGNVDAGTDGSFGFRLSTSFSLGPDPANGGFRLSERKLARHGQALVTIFRDDDGDGVRDPGEEAIEDVGVEAGFRRTDALTNDKGMALVDELKPFVPVLVGIDEGSLADPFLVPAAKGVVVVPRPGVPTKIELAVSPSGEIEGMLLGTNGFEIGGVELELVDRAGNVVATTASEFDGFFLFDRVAYGTYSLRLARGSARALGVERELAKQLTLARDKDIVRTGVTRLRTATATVIAARGGTGED